MSKKSNNKNMMDIWFLKKIQYIWFKSSVLRIICFLRITMLTIIQRVTEAQVVVNNETIGKINQGIMALVAIEKEDAESEANRLLEKILNYRIFADENDKMNLSLRDIEGGLLVVPQFTLAANTKSGNRPSFTSAAAPEKGFQLFSYFCQQAMEKYPSAEFGQFGADMKVSLINDGPATFTLKTY